MVVLFNKLRLELENCQAPHHHYQSGSQNIEELFLIEGEEIPSPQARYTTEYLGRLFPPSFPKKAVEKTSQEWFFWMCVYEYIAKKSAECTEYDEEKGKQHTEHEERDVRGPVETIQHHPSEPEGGPRVEHKFETCEKRELPQAAPEKH